MATKRSLVHSRARSGESLSARRYARGSDTALSSFHQLAQSYIPWVILGHSERRSLFHETSAEVGKKTAAALKEGLSVIACVGETLEQRESNKTTQVVREQLDGIKAEISDWRSVDLRQGPSKTSLTSAVYTCQQSRHCL